MIIIYIDCIMEIMAVLCVGVKIKHFTSLFLQNAANFLYTFTFLY